MDVHCLILSVWSDAPVVSCPQYVEVEKEQLHLARALSLSCDVDSYPTSIVNWRCCGTDRDIPDSVVYEKVCSPY